MKPEQEPAWSYMNGNESLEFLPFEQLGPAPAPQKQGISPGPILRLIRRNLFLIGLVTAAATGATYALVWDDPRSYEGEFQLLVEPVTAEARLAQPSALSRGEDSLAGGLDYSTLTQVLTSRSVLDGILSQIQTQYPEVTHNSLNKNLTVERVGEDPLNQTKLIRVGYEAEDQQEVLFVLEALKTGYLQFGLEDRKKHIGRGVAFIEGQLPNLKQRVSTLEKQLQALQQQSQISDLKTKGETLAERAQALETQQLEAQRDLLAQKQVAADLEQQLGLPLNQANQVLSANEFNERPAIQDLDNQIRAVELEVQNSPLTPAHPAMQELLSRRESLHAARKQEVNKVVTLASNQGNASTIQLNSLQRAQLPRLAEALNEIRVLEIRSQAATQAAAAVAQELRQFPEIKRQYNQLERNLNFATTELEQRLLQYETLKVEAAQKDIPWQIPSEPDLLRDEEGNPLLSESGRNKKLALGLLGGFVLGVSAALLREKQQDVFHNTEDLQAQASVPMLGSLPYHTSALDLEFASGEASGPELLRADSALEFERAAETLYTKIRFLSDPPIRSLTVSSVAPQDGKSTVAIHLAQAAANMGQRVLLVDSDLSSPQLHTYFEVPNFEGVSDILSLDLDPNQVIVRSPYHANLSLLTAGQPVTQTSKVLGGQPMHYLMAQLNDLFDFVVYDASHLGGHSDANFVAANTNGLLLVVGIGKTRHSQVVKTLDSLRAKRLRVLGIVANFSGASTQTLPEEGFTAYDDGAYLDELEDEFEIFRVGAGQ
jgi:capsular exopolysaccharide synthesis family protein